MSASTPRKLSIAMIGQKGLPVSKDAGGVERHVEELATRLAERGHDVLVYVRPRFTATRDSTYKGVRLQRMPSIPTKSLDTFTHTLLASISVLFKNVDVIHYHGIGPASLAWIPRLFKPRAKIIATVHALDWQHPKWGPLAKLYLRYGAWIAVRVPHATVAVSKNIRAFLKKKYGVDVRYVPNGADLIRDPGAEMLARWGLEPGGYILNVARLVKLKGIHYLIDAYGRIATDKKLVIVGADEHGNAYADELRKVSAGNSSIIFTGFQTDRTLRQLFANAYLYVHPSITEGLSVSILEAMAAGRCPLVSDIPGNLEPIDHSGITFVSGDPADLAEKLQELVNHPEIVAELGKKARNWVAREYDWDKIVAETERLYDKVAD
ncbi:glycosyltransferase family 4 protein [Candidatus Uhrbacteria bacterium]|nr:glycosyltransferase family 4 protein [Candidatus Uhrbacteria bacterium]